MHAVFNLLFFRLRSSLWTHHAKRVLIHLGRTVCPFWFWYKKNVASVRDTIQRHVTKVAIWCHIARLTVRCNAKTDYDIKTMRKNHDKKAPESDPGRYISDKYKQSRRIEISRRSGFSFNCSRYKRHCQMDGDNVSDSLAKSSRNEER